MNDLNTKAEIFGSWPFSMSKIAKNTPKYINMSKFNCFWQNYLQMSNIFCNFASGNSG